MLVQRMGQITDPVHIGPVKAGGQIRMLQVQVSVWRWRRVAVVHRIGADLVGSIQLQLSAKARRKKGYGERGGWWCFVVGCRNEHQHGGAGTTEARGVTHGNHTLISLRNTPSIGTRKRAAVRTALVAEKNTMVNVDRVKVLCVVCCVLCVVVVVVVRNNNASSSYVLKFSRKSADVPFGTVVV
jgi:hypothetical protein